MRQGARKASGLGPSGPQEQSNMECPRARGSPKGGPLRVQPTRAPLGPSPAWTQPILSPCTPP